MASGAGRRIASDGGQHPVRLEAELLAERDGQRAERASGSPEIIIVAGQVAAIGCPAPSQNPLFLVQAGPRLGRCEAWEGSGVEGRPPGQLAVPTHGKPPD